MWVVMGGEQPMVALALLLIYSVLEIVFKQGWAWAVKERKYLSRCQETTGPCQNYLLHQVHWILWEIISNHIFICWFKQRNGFCEVQLMPLLTSGPRRSFSSFWKYWHYKLSTAVEISSLEISLFRSVLTFPRLRGTWWGAAYIQWRVSAGE